MNAVAKRKKRKTNFGERLRALREAAGLTQADLGRRVEMGYQEISRFERGAVEPNWPTVIDLATALNVGVEAFNLPTSEPAAEPDPDPESPTVRRGGKKK